MSTTPTAHELLQRERNVKRLYKYLLADLAWRLDHEVQLFESAAEAADVDIADPEVKVRILNLLREKR